jgi:wyosine [tRNA(Phe)-imidazoG37] synthetase (radical SAM superfamily)
LLNRLGIKIAVISNSSLIWKKDVREDLSKADLVSLKIDALSENIWRKINRPHRSLKLKKILDGVIEFSNTFEGELTTETMLVRDINDVETELENIASFIGKLNPKKSYISIPTRPPSETWVKSSSEERINIAYQIFSERSIDTEYLVGYEGNEFAFTGNVEDDLLSITSVHPMREDAVNEYLRKANEDWNIIKKLANQGKLIEVKYNDMKFYIRKFTGLN